MPFADVSLLHGSFPALLGSLALCAFGYAVIRWDRRWWWTRVLPVSASAFLLVVAVNAALDLQHRFGEAIPASFLVWATMPLVAVGVSTAGWRHRRPVRRATSILAIPLTAAFAANLINQYYGYEPTLGALFDADIHHQLDSKLLDLAAPPSSTTRADPGRNVAGLGSTATTTTTSAPSLDRARLVASGHGFVSTLAIPGATSGFVARDAYVWVPPAFFANPRPHLPVVMMLAGVPGQPANMIRAGQATVVADRYATTHGGVAPILVFPDSNGSFTADTECVDSKRGNAETYLTRDVPAFVTSRFAAATGPTRWGIVGYSEGGTCAMDLALAHPDVFGSFVDIAGDAFPNLGVHGDAKAKAIAGLYGGNPAGFDAHDPMLLARRPQDRTVSAWFEAGTSDHRIQGIAEQLDATLRADGLTSRFTSAPGGHDFYLAARAVADSFPWLAHLLGT